MLCMGRGDCVLMGGWRRGAGRVAASGGRRRLWWAGRRRGEVESLSPGGRLGMEGPRGRSGGDWCGGEMCGRDPCVGVAGAEQ